MLNFLRLPIPTTDLDDDFVQFHSPASPREADFLPAPGRLVSKQGRLLIQHHTIQKLRTYGGTPADCFLTLLHSHWWITICWFCVAYLLSWGIFALFWLAVHYLNPDACLAGLDGFLTAYVFSVETQTTVGYGEYKIEGDCALGVTLLTIQCVCGSILDACLLGLVFAKLARPRSRRRTIVYSDTACIAQSHQSATADRYLMFRIGDMRKSSLLEAHVRVHIYFKSHATLPNGKVVHPFDCFELDVGYDTGRDRVFTLLPVVVWHKIDKSSPLWGVGPGELADLPLEIIVVMEGTVEAIGAVTAAMTSYINTEIVFNQRFAPMITIGPDGQAHVDFKLLHRTIPVPEGDPLTLSGCFPDPNDGNLNLLSQNEPEPKPCRRITGDLIYFGNSHHTPF